MGQSERRDDGPERRYLTDALLHARVNVVCKTMGWIVPRSGAPTVKGVYDAIQILDALAVSGARMLDKCVCGDAASVPLRRRPSASGHLPECRESNCAWLGQERGESKPEGMSDFSWFGVFMTECADGCPVAHRSIERGRELWKEHGWL
jgi:hypothetical protein